MSIYLYVLCIQLFILNYGYIKQESLLSPQINVYLFWVIISSAFILCVFFSAFVFMKINNSIIYLFNMYFIYFIKCVLFLLIMKTRAGDAANANKMLKIVLCLGFLFVFLEFLHMQTSKTFIRDKYILAGSMGILSCISIFTIIAYVLYFRCIPIIAHYGYYLPYHMVAYLLYILYALRILVFSIMEKEAKSSMLFKCLFTAFIILWILLATPSVYGLSLPLSPLYILCNIFTLEILIIFGCTQIIPLGCVQVADNAPKGSLQNLMMSFKLMLAFRLVFFTFLSTGVAVFWRGFS